MPAYSKGLFPKYVVAAVLRCMRQSASGIYYTAFQKKTIRFRGPYTYKQGPSEVKHLWGRKKRMTEAFLGSVYL